MGRKQVCAIFIIVIFILPVLSSFIQIPDQKRQISLKNDPGNLKIRSDPPLVLWNKTWGGPKSGGNGVAVDANGSVYYVGFTGSYLALFKFFSNGTLAWQNTNSISGSGYGVAVDIDGSIYCTGSADTDLVLVKFFSNGTKAWVVELGTGGMTSAVGYGVAVDNKGAIYCAGLEFMVVDVYSILVKFFSNGTRAWTYFLEMGSYCTGVAVDNTGFVYCVNGWCLYKIDPISQTIVWENFFVTFMEPKGVTVDANSSIYCVGVQRSNDDLSLSKFLSNGTEVWNTTWGGSNSDEGAGVAVDAKGFIYCVGHTLSYGATANLALIAFFPNGTMAWQFIGNDSNDTYGTGVALDVNGSIYCAGYIGTTFPSYFLLLKLGNPLPSAPRNLRASPAAGSIILTWQAPSSNGITDIINYKIYRGSALGAETYLTTIDNILNYTDPGVINGQIYYYKVSAVNSDGEGPLSNEASASNYRAPQILAYSVTPEAGTQNTLFNFSLIYRQPDNRSPSLVNVLLNETKFEMKKRDFSDNNYVTGVFYQYLTYLPPGTYIYSFECNDSVSYNSTELEILVVTPTMNSNAQLVWAKIWGGQQNDVLKGVTVDSNGSIYCVGGSRGYLVLTKFFSNGTMAWENTNSTPEDNIPADLGFNCDYDHNGVAIDASGSIYCVGTRNGLLLCVKFFSNGSKAWEIETVLSFGGGDYGLGVTVDNKGFIYCVGGNYNPIMWYGWTVLIKISSNGTKLWEIRRDPGLPGKGVVVDSAGFIYYTEDWCVSGGSGDSGLSKVFPNGTLIWTKIMNSFAARGIAVDCNNSIYCVGDQPGLGGRDLGLFKYFPNGTKMWQTTWINPYEDYGVGVALAADGFIYCVGSTGNTSNLVLVKFFPNGTKAWQTIWDDSQQSYGNGVVLDSQAAIYCVGYTFINTSKDFLLLKYIEVDPNLPRTNILEPSNGAFLSGDKIWINGTASAGTNHTIQQVLINDTRFTNATTLIGNDSGKFAFYNSSCISDGILQINVTVINEVDQKGVGIIFFRLDNTPPSAADITSPIGGAFRRGSIWINATATDTIGLKNVTFYRDAGILLGTSSMAPYSLKWNTSLTSDGNHTLYIRAFDRSGNYLDSNTVTITVDNTPPGVASILNPALGDCVKFLCYVRIDATVLDETSGIKNVTLYRDAGVLIGKAESTMWGSLISWDTTGLDGVHTLYTRAFDRAENSLDSFPVIIKVDNTPPSAAVVTNPVVGAYVKGTIWLNATAMDAMGIRNVTFYRDDAVMIGTDTIAPYAIQWNTIGLDGAHTLYIRAFDRAGFYDYEIMHAIWIDGTPYPRFIYAANYLDSAPIAIIVDNTVPTSATVTAPAPGAHVHGTIWINATATDAIGIKNVTFYRDACILLGTAFTAPYGVQWQTGGYGVHTLYVRAFDNAGNCWNSLNISITVITMPTTPWNLQANPGKGQVCLTWQAPASDGGSAITSYKIYRGTSSGNEKYLVTIANISSFTDTNLIHGRTYYYRVSAVNEIGESSWSAEVSGMVSISWGRNPTFGWTIIILLMVGLVGLSGGILYFNRTTKSTTRKIIGLPKAPIGQKESKFWKYISTEVVEDGGLSEMGPESLWNSLRLRFSRLYKSAKWAQALLLLETLDEIAEFLGDDEKIKELSVKYNEIQGKQHNLSEMGPESLWNSLMLRFNRLYKSAKWAQALVLLRTLNEIAEFLGDDTKIKALSAKHDEIKVKRQQNSYMN